MITAVRSWRQAMTTRNEWFAPETSQRVEIPAHKDAWMRGDRFGVIEGYTRQLVARVRLDKSNRIILCDPNELTIVG